MYITKISPKSYTPDPSFSMSGKTTPTPPTSNIPMHSVFADTYDCIKPLVHKDNTKHHGRYLSKLIQANRKRQVHNLVHICDDYGFHNLNGFTETLRTNSRNRTHLFDDWIKQKNPLFAFQVVTSINQGKRHLITHSCLEKAKSKNLIFDLDDEDECMEERFNLAKKVIKQRMKNHSYLINQITQGISSAGQTSAQRRRSKTNHNKSMSVYNKKSSKAEFAELILRRKETSQDEVQPRSKTPAVLRYHIQLPIIKKKEFVINDMHPSHS